MASLPKYVFFHAVHLYVALFATLFAHAEQVRFERLFTELGYQDVGPIVDITQDKSGFIWIGGESGVGRYDGVRLNYYSLEDSLISDLHIDDENTIWVGSDKGVFTYEAESDRFINFSDVSNDTFNLRSQIIYAIKSDSNSYYLAGLAGLYIVDRKSKQISRYLISDNEDSEDNQNSIRDVLIEGQTLWLATANQGLAHFDLTTKKFKFFRHSKTNLNSLIYDETRTLLSDSQDRIWIGTYGGGLSRFDPKKQTFSNFRYDPEHENTLPSNTIWDIYEDRNNEIWLATDAGGLARYNPLHESFTTYKNDPRDKTTILSNVARAIYEDNRGDLWIGAFPKGISYFNRSTALFENYTAIPDEATSLSHKSILSLIEDSDRNIWIGTEGGLNKYNKDTKRFKQFTNQNPKYDKLKSNAILALEILDNDLWIGTWSGGLYTFDLNKERITKSFNKLEFPESPNSLFIWDIQKDLKNNIWIATETGGLNYYDVPTQRFSSFKHNTKDSQSLSDNFIRTLALDHKNTLWLGTQSGLDSKQDILSPFIHHQLKTNSNGNLVDTTIRTRAVIEDTKQRIWLGTNDDGAFVYNPENKKIRHFNTSNGLKSNYVATIVEDQLGNIWLGTTHGLARINPSDWSVRVFHKGQGLIGNTINRNASLLDSEGNIYIGTTDGLSIFNPKLLMDSPHPFEVKLTNFKIFNKVIKSSSHPEIFSGNITHNPPINLSYEHSMISFEFAALSFRSPEWNTFKYKLEGFDNQWIDAINNTATYTNLHPGTYQFKVKAKNSDGDWSANVVSQAITIQPPPWLTWWAYTLYTLSIAAIVALYMLKQKRKIAYERSINEKLRQLDKMKDDFLANTSHELRTPLNGIIGITDSLIDGAAGDVSDVMASNLRMISVSGRRLASLVNDILDFSKLRNNNIKLKKVSLDAHKLVNDVITFCEPSIGAKHITLINDISPDLKPIFADENRIQQILYNLIGNSIKFTHRGTINIEAEERENKIWIRVKDTGIGIPEDKVSSIFESFHQIESHNDRQATGTGLGLTVTKQLVELHDGHIEVQSTVGEGSSFLFSLQIADGKAQNTQLEEDSKAESSISTVSESYNDENTNTYPERKLSYVDKKSEERVSQLQENIEQDEFKKHAELKILIVDDEPINRQVLLNLLKMQNYQTVEASCGQEALDAIFQQKDFDLVLLDIMMPNMNGYDVCSIIRETYPVQELPIIFLTAKNRISDLVDGFKVGANDFLTKPISNAELISRVQTHLQLCEVNRKLEDRIQKQSDQVEDATQELDALDNIVSSINQEVRLDRLLEVILNEALTLFPTADYSAYWKLDSKNQYFELLSTKDFDNSDELKCCMPKKEVENYYLNPKFELRDDIYFIDIESFENSGLDTGDLPSFKSLVTIAMRTKGELIGALILGSKSNISAFQEKQTITFERFRTHVLSALTKARLMDILEGQYTQLEEISLTDQLTSLHNRRFLFKHLDADIALIKRKRYSYTEQQRTGTQNDWLDDSLIFFLIDIDNFKNINDEYGHTVGDKMLIQMKAVLQSVFRESDYLIRWGGEEFLVVARFCDRKAGPVLAERLRATMENKKFSTDEGPTIRKTCSIGFACYPFISDDVDAIKWTQVIDIADHCLYAAKKTQRNAWVGINATQNTQDDQLFKHIVEFPEQLIMNEQIAIDTNIDHSRPLIWK